MAISPFTCSTVMLSVRLLARRHPQLRSSVLAIGPATRIVYDTWLSIRIAKYMARTYFQ